MIALRRLLVATDFSAESKTALAYGRELAAAFGATLHVVHVVDHLVTRLGYALPMGPIDPQGELERIERDALKRSVSERDRRELHAVTDLRIGTSPAAEIVTYASEHDIDLIVIGATGRGALDRMMTGSVADKVIRWAPCPVLAVRTPEREFVDDARGATPAGMPAGV
jgi:nucleotide-binding universal stress UspA family protein